MEHFLLLPLLCVSPPVSREQELHRVHSPCLHGVYHLKRGRQVASNFTSPVSAAKGDLRSSHEYHFIEGQG